MSFRRRQEIHPPTRHSRAGGNPARNRHREEQRDKAIQKHVIVKTGLLRYARNDTYGFRDPPRQALDRQVAG